MAANVSRQVGFKPIRHISGSPWNGATRTYLGAAADSTATYIGDIVMHNSLSGAAGTFVYGVNCEGMPTATRTTGTTDGQANVGVVVGFSPDPTNLMLRHRAASTNRLMYVCVDPTVVYECQEDADTTPITSAMVGSCFGILTTAGSTVTGMSSMIVDSTSIASTSTLPLKLVAMSTRVDNTLSTGTTDKTKFEFILNTGWFMPNSVGTA